MIYSRWDPTTGLYDYFEADVRLGLNDDLSAPKMPAQSSALGVPSTECGREMPSGAVFVGTGETARGCITPPADVALYGVDAGGNGATRSLMWFAGGVVLTLVGVWAVARQRRRKR